MTDFGVILFTNARRNRNHTGRLSCGNIMKGSFTMLTEERYAAILRILAEKKAVTVQELTRALDASESTVRRDLTALHKSGRLYKVYGGATAVFHLFL